jgi:hypothetical protein
VDDGRDGESTLLRSDPPRHGADRALRACLGALALLITNVFELVRD